MHKRRRRDGRDRNVDPCSIHTKQQLPAAHSERRAGETRSGGSMARRDWLSSASAPFRGRTLTTAWRPCHSQVWTTNYSGGCCGCAMAGGGAFRVTSPAMLSNLSYHGHGPQASQPSERVSCVGSCIPESSSEHSQGTGERLMMADEEHGSERLQTLARRSPKTLHSF